MPRNPKCEGNYDILNLIEEATSGRDLEKIVSDWPSGPYLGRSEKTNKDAAVKEARNAAELKAREAADDWCKARAACPNGKTCHLGKIRYADPVVVYSPALEEYVYYLTIKKIECKCIRV